MQNQSSARGAPMAKEHVDQDAPAGMGVGMGAGMGAGEQAQEHAQLVAQAWDAIDRAMTRIWLVSPFFSALALFARLEVSFACPTAATDGQRLVFNPGFYVGLSAAERAGVLLHELLHAALLHVTRRGQRDPPLWNIAADIVVNGLIMAELQASPAAATTVFGAGGGTSMARRTGGAGGARAHYALPDGHVRIPELDGLSVEEVFSKLLQQPDDTCPVLAAAWADLTTLPDNTQGAAAEPGSATAAAAKDSTASAPLDAYWRRALEVARQEAEQRGQGALPAGLARDAEALSPARLDWRSHLARFVTRTPSDFAGYDRRFVYRRQYLETLEGESVRVLVAIDTSGSVSNRELAAFLSEVGGILGSYPHVQCELFYADAALYSPYPLDQRGPLPPPSGGGGTDFRPFFAQVAAEYLPGMSLTGGPILCVYLTDGQGTFPEVSPDLPILWVVVAGGREPRTFPFGETTTLCLEK